MYAHVLADASIHVHLHMNAHVHTHTTIHTYTGAWGAETASLRLRPFAEVPPPEGGVLEKIPYCLREKKTFFIFIG